MLKKVQNLTLISNNRNILFRSKTNELQIIILQFIIIFGWLIAFQLFFFNFQKWSLTNQINDVTSKFVVSKSKVCQQKFSILNFNLVLYDFSFYNRFSVLFCCFILLRLKKIEESLFLHFKIRTRNKINQPFLPFHNFVWPYLEWNGLIK